METTFVWASVGLSIMLLVPVVMEFFKRNLPVLFGIVMTLTTLYLLAPSSPEIRAVWVPLSHLPVEFVNQMIQFLSRWFH